MPAMQTIKINKKLDSFTNSRESRRCSSEVSHGLELTKERAEVKAYETNRNSSAFAGRNL